MAASLGGDVVVLSLVAGLATVIVLIVLAAEIGRRAKPPSATTPAPIAR